MTGLQVSGLAKSFGGLKAVTDVSFSVAPAEIVSLIGPNGAGKTTLFNLISGYYRPDGGEITFGGTALNGCKPWEIVSAGIARTFQNIQLLGALSVLENVRVGAHCRTRVGLWDALVRSATFRQEEAVGVEQARELLDLVGLSDKQDWPATGLAYGDQRRLEIARALATKPQLLMLDEPAAGMVATEIDALIELVRYTRSTLQVAVLLISHDIHMTMKLSDKVVVLNYGEKISEGPPRVVQSDAKVIEVYLGRRRSQTEVASS